VAIDLWWPAFEEAFRRTRRISVSADLAGVHRTTVYETLHRRPDVRDRFVAVRSEISSARARRSADRADALMQSRR